MNDLTSLSEDVSSPGGPIPCLVISVAGTHRAVASKLDLDLWDSMYSGLLIAGKETERAYRHMEKEGKRRSTSHLQTNVQIVSMELFFLRHCF